MIKYILIVITIVLLILIRHTQAKKEKSIEKYFDKTNIENKISTNINNSSKSEIKIKADEKKEDKRNKLSLNFTAAQDTTDNVSDFDKEMEENEEDIIVKSLEEKETLTRTYNGEEEENIPVSEPDDTDTVEEVSISPLELDNIEITNGLQPKIEYNDSVILEDIPMTESTLEEIEISSGLQNTEESENQPLEDEGFEPI